ncbi:MAG: right-handed parallel beta-helix repeat-containing protein [Desulfobulbaceae bacterium]|nr:right-handed parallel beta-helix repeat-containing protein [Desulfobulbaceae bacterium]
MTIFTLLAIALINFFATPAPASAKKMSAVTIKLGNTFYVIVNPNNILKVPSEYPSINLAIQAVEDGGTIQVDDGVYNEDLWILGEDKKTYTIVSKNGPDKTIISGSGTNSVVTFSDRSKSTLEGFSIKNGKNTYGGGILCGISSTPKIINCSIFNNQAVTGGGGIHLPDYSSPTIENCRITGNAANGSYTESYGGGLQMSKLAKPTIKNCLFKNNTSTHIAGAMAIAEAQPKIINCAFINNSAINFAGAIAINYSEPQIINCTFRDNHTTGNRSRGGAISSNYNLPNTIVTNSVFWNNYEPTGLNDLRVQYNVPFDHVSYSLLIYNKDILSPYPDSDHPDNNTNIAVVNPLFVDGSDYLISGSSPAIDKGNPSVAPANDIQYQSRPQGSGVDMGADEFQAP